MQLTISQIIMLVIAVIAALIILYFVSSSLEIGPVVDIPRDYSP